MGVGARFGPAEREQEQGGSEGENCVYTFHVFGVEFAIGEVSPDAGETE